MARSSSRCWLGGALLTLFLGALGRSVPAAPLNVNAELQRIATRLLRRAKPVEGAIVAVDPKTGRVLVWAERSASKGPTQRSQLAASGKAHPTSSEPAPIGVIRNPTYPAASLFKLVTTAALLDEVKISPRQKVCIAGGAHRLDAKHLLKPSHAEGRCAPFFDALGHSRNAVFAQLANRYLTPRTLQTTAERLGFNTAVPFSPPELAALMGTFSAPATELPFARSAAGFLGSSLSPLGAVYLATSIASGGRAQTLHFGQLEHTDHTRIQPRRVLSGRTARTLGRMMEVTVRSGTSLKAFSDDKYKSHFPGLRIAGKTGTLRANAHSPMTSWFIGFAPSRSPKIAISVLLQNGEIWQSKANEIANDFLRAYFTREGKRGVTPPVWLDAHTGSTHTRARRTPAMNSTPTNRKLTATQP